MTIVAEAKTVLNFKNATLLAGVVALAVGGFYSSGWLRGLDIFGGACLLLNHFSSK